MGEFTEVIRQCARLCDSHKSCGDCELFAHNAISCFAFMRRHPEAAEEIIEEWAKEHPERTYLSALQEHFPEADIESVVGQACPGFLAKGWPTSPLDCIRDDEDIQLCEKCWNSLVPAEE